MDKQYWDTVAQKYDDEIFDVLRNDKEQIIAEHLKVLSRKYQSINDFGCGVGKFIPILTRLFKEVHAIDLSDECLKRAALEANDLPNIDFFKSDLCREESALPQADCGICVNALMMPQHDNREIFLKNIYKSIRKEGVLLLVVPSLESFNYTNARFHEWNLREGFDIEDSVGGMIECLDGNVDDTLRGVINIHGVLTKHYLKEEMDVFLSSHRFEIEKVEKLEYAWATEFANPPVWLKDPYPWDWFFWARKI